MYFVSLTYNSYKPARGTAAFTSLGEAPSGWSGHICCNLGEFCRSSGELFSIQKPFPL
jgi:hypothetical protein